MKKPSLLFLVLACLVMACTDKVEEYVTYEKWIPIEMSLADFRAQSVQVESPHALTNAGKIYTYKGFLFINEREKGIHVFDNRNPALPAPVSFIKIIGNADIAIRNDVLYADCLMDLVSFDVSNPSLPVFKARTENILPYQYYIAQNQKVIVGWEKKVVTEKREREMWGCFEIQPNLQTSNGVNTMSSPSAPSVGTGGSMARFTIVEDYLYVVDNSYLKVFDVKTNQAQKVQETFLRWGLETIFPAEGKLFIGTLQGMYIFSLANPASPAQLSFYSHLPACDPVVVQGNYAFVTLRSGTMCNNANHLEVIDISNPSLPTLVKAYPMQHPHGLGVQGNTLFLCEGAHGLKTFDITDKTLISNNLLQHLQGFDAYDVIPMGNVLMLIGKNGFFQYDCSNPKNLQLLSSIPVK